MKLYKDFYENFVAMDSGFKTIPQLILLCEDEKHMAETFREIVVNGLGIDKLNYITQQIYAKMIAHQNTAWLNLNQTQ